MGQYPNVAGGTADGFFDRIAALLGKRRALVSAIGRMAPGFALALVPHT